MRFRIKSDKSRKISGKDRHISLDIWDVNLAEYEFCKCARIIHIGASSSTVPHDLFVELRCLRVLDLQRSHLKGLSESIGNLKHLRYLDLSYAGISVLPEQTCTLYNLQTLILLSCDGLCELPRNIRNLINLQHLIMERFCWPQLQGIGRLTCLKTFP